MRTKLRAAKKLSAIRGPALRSRSAVVILVANRPHIKTHKSPVLAAMQRDAGAAGVTCQNLGEAEIMAGLDNILISYSPLGEEKTGRLGALLRDVNVTVATDNPVVADGLTRAATIAGRPLTVVVECDTGRKRAGVERDRRTFTQIR